MYIIVFVFCWNWYVVSTVLSLNCSSFPFVNISECRSIKIHPVLLLHFGIIIVFGFTALPNLNHSVTRSFFPVSDDDFTHVFITYKIRIVKIIVRVYNHLSCKRFFLFYKYILRLTDQHTNMIFDRNNDKQNAITSMKTVQNVYDMCCWWLYEAGQQYLWTVHCTAVRCHRYLLNVKFCRIRDSEKMYSEDCGLRNLLFQQFFPQRICDGLPLLNLCYFGRKWNKNIHLWWTFTTHRMIYSMWHTFLFLFVFVIPYQKDRNIVVRSTLTKEWG